ncbi:MAG: hypothetical protein OHK0023_28510 [Anaerolineae bacterium]
MRRVFRRTLVALFVCIALFGFMFAGNLSQPSRLSAQGGSSRVGPGINGERRLVVKFLDGSNLRFQNNAPVFTPGSASSGTGIMSAIGQVRGVTISRLFSQPAAKFDADRQTILQNTGKLLPDLNMYHAVDFPLSATDADVAAVMASLQADPNVEFVYEEPAPVPMAAYVFDTGNAPLTLDKPPTTPDLTSSQFYLQPASNNPPGIDAVYMWNLPGGAGNNVRVIDVEYDWEVDHEDLSTSVNTLVSGERYTGFGPDHGTAVAGILASLNNGYGTTGIVYAADMRVGGMHFGGIYNSAQSISSAADAASVGDVILLEMQTAPPNPLPPCPSGCTCGSPSFRYSPMEIFRANFDAIQYGTNLGRIIVMTAGNGYNDLDWFTPANYGTITGYPLGNPFDRTLYDSGAIYVGAGTSGVGGGTPRAPHCYSNHGTRIDVQGIGDSVAGTGYGDHPSFNAAASGFDPDQYYTNFFSGTSSSGPIVAGAAAALQSFAKQKGFLYTPTQMRQLLNSTGVAQNGTQLIGPRPNLRSAVMQVTPDTIGVRRGSNFYLRNYNSDGVPNLTVNYGLPTDIPLLGDWDGDGDDTVGVFRNGLFMLKNNNTDGIPDIYALFGEGTDIPVVGDWDGNGTDTIGIVRNGVFMLRNTNTSGLPDIYAQYGLNTDIPLVGDWDGNGTDTIGIFRNGLFMLRNANTTGLPDIYAQFGAGTDTPIVGDWDNNNTDTLGVYRSSTGIYYLRNTNSTGGVDRFVQYGAAGDTPVRGVFQIP